MFKNQTTLASLLLLLLVFLSSVPISIYSLPPLNYPSTSNSTNVPCKLTLYPKLCRSMLSTFHSFSPSTNLYDYGKFTIKQSLKQAQRLSKSINYYLTHDNYISRLSPREIGALRDCHELNGLNVDYLGTISNELKLADTLNDELVERVSCLLSGVVTNHQTCFDGLVEMESGIFGSDLFVPMSNVTQIYSVSLGLVKSALDKNLKKHKRRNGADPGAGAGGADSSSRLREPLEALIKVLRKRPCTSTSCPSDERVLLDDTNQEGLLINSTVYVNPYYNGTNSFPSIGDALAAVPNNSKLEDGYFVIYVVEGVYEEYVVIPKYKKNIMLVGAGINRTVITGNHSYVDGWTTFNSSSFTVSGERFVAVDITFRNTAGPEKHQAVAVRNSADLSSFYRCSFEGYQDTLYAHNLRQFYRDCDIFGTVDFIFGNAIAVFQNCHLYARKPLPNQKNAFTAQGRTDPNQESGISIHNCTIDAAPDLAIDSNSSLTYLGRPWKPYSRTVVMQSYIGAVVDQAGWLEWNGTAGLDTLYYGEFENYGPGANTSTRVQWPGYRLMDVTEAVNFTVYNFTMGDTWLPLADIPFTGGLLVQKNDSFSI